MKAKIDIFLASGAGAPAALKVLPPSVTPATRFFTEPMVNFEYHAAPVYLTAPDILAIISSLVLLIRFAHWLRGGKK